MGVAADDLITSTPLAHDGRVFVGSFDGRVIALDGLTGELIWAHDTGAAVPSSAALFDRRIIIGSRSYDLVARPGPYRRNAGLEPLLLVLVDRIEPHRARRCRLCRLGPDAQALRAIDAADGRLIWEFDTGGSAWGQPAVSMRGVFIGAAGVADYMVDHQAGFYAVDRRSGKGLWRISAPRPGTDKLWGFTASPAVGEGLVFAAGLDGRFYGFGQEPTGS